MRFLVTGAAGFAGSHLCKLLRSRGDDVLTLGRRAGSDFAVDVRDADEVHRAVSEARPDGLFHLAAVAYLPRAEADPTSTDAVNRQGTFNVLDAARSAGARTLIVSSASVYGRLSEAELPATEDLELRPQDVYGRSKAAAEQECVRRRDEQEIVRVRPFNHTGPGQSADYVCSDFARQVADCEAGRQAPRIEVGDLGSERDFSDVRDVVEAYRLAWERGGAGEVYNVCSGRSVAVGAVLDTLVSMARVEVEIDVCEAGLRPGALTRYFGSFDKLNAATGWRPTRELGATLGDLLDDWRTRGGTHGTA